MKNFLNKLFVGGYWRTINGRIYGMPKVAPFFILGFFLVGLFQEDSLIDVPILFYSGLVILAVAFFGFYWAAYHPLKTSRQWYESMQPALSIYDPDGWDRKNFYYSFNEELITKEEFLDRVSKSTVTWHKK